MRDVIGVVITVTRDDFPLIENLGKSLARQTIRPKKWIIVDDSSNSTSRNLIQRYADKHHWIEYCVEPSLINEKLRGARIAGLFSYGIGKCPTEWTFCSKIDSDMELEDKYLEDIYQEFHDDPKLGIASGNCRINTLLGGRMERTVREHTRGGLKTYRRECYFQISGIVPVEGWDTIDNFQAQMLGWKTRNFKLIIASQKRRTGQKVGLLRTAFNQGIKSHYLGYYPPYFYARCLSITMKKYPLVCSLSMLSGYYYAVAVSKPVYKDEHLRLYLRKKQKEKMINFLSIFNNREG